MTKKFITYLTAFCGALIILAAGTSAKALSYQAYQNGALVNDNGTIYFISGTVKVPFTSWSAFTGLGYSAKNVVDGDLSNYSVSQNYTINTANDLHPWGQWLSFNGTVYYSIQDGLIPVPSPDIFTNNGGQWNLVVKANKYDLAENTNLPLLANNDTRVIGAPIYNFSGGNQDNQNSASGSTSTDISIPNAPLPITSDIAGSLKQPTLSTSSPAGQFIFRSAAKQPMAVYNFTASGSPVTITELNFTAPAPLIWIYAPGGNSPSAAGATSSITNLNIIVPNTKEGVDIPVSADFAVNTPPNQISNLTLVGIKYVSAGQTSSLTVSLPSNPVSPIDSIPGVSISGPTVATLTDGLTLLANVTVNATGGQGITLNQLPIVISSVGKAVASSSPDNLTVTDNGYAVSTSNSPVGFDVGGGSSTTLIFKNDNYIAAGTSKTYAISLVLQGAVDISAGTSTITTSLGNAGGFTFNDTASGAQNILGSSGGVNLLNYPANKATAHN